MSTAVEKMNSIQSIWGATDAVEEKDAKAQGVPPSLEKKKSWRDKVFKRKKKSVSEQPSSPVEQGGFPEVPPIGQVLPSSGQPATNSGPLVLNSGPLGSSSSEITVPSSSEITMPRSGEISYPSSGEFLAPPRKRAMNAGSLNIPAVPEISQQAPSSVGSDASMSTASTEPASSSSLLQRSSSIGVVSLAGKQLSSGQVKELTEAFALFDSNGDGRISAVELGAVLRSLGDTPREDELAAMIKEVDVDGDGTIDLNEFLRLHQLAMQAGGATDADSDLRQAFEVFDLDKNGFITAAELKEVLNSLGQDICSDECARMVRAVDADGDGQVCFSEFRRMMGAVIHV